MQYTASQYMILHHSTLQDLQPVAMGPPSVGRVAVLITWW